MLRRGQHDQPRSGRPSCSADEHDDEDEEHEQQADDDQRDQKRGRAALDCASMETM